MVLYFADIYVGDRPSAYLDSFSGKGLLEKVAAHLTKQEELKGFWE
jgi:translation initiation factor RLI1